MKITKTKLKELVKQIMSEDIMDKEIKNPKTGNKIKVRTALQLPDEHPANKKAKDMVAKTPTKDDDKKDTKKGKIKSDPFDVGGPAHPNVPKDKPKDTPKSIKDIESDGDEQAWADQWDDVESDFENAESVPNFPNAIPIVFGGGTSLVKGFMEVVGEQFNQDEFPIEVNNFTLVEDAHTAVARGCLSEAQLIEEEEGENQEEST